MSDNNLSRRNFLKATAGVVAGVAMVNMIQPAFAKDLKIKTVKLDSIPTNPIEVAKNSELVQSSWNYLLSKINTINDLKLRAQVLGLYKDTYPTFMLQYQSKASVADVYAKLQAQNLIDPAKTSVDNLFPPLKGVNEDPQPFFSAPGSGYQSHHAYPGGLVTHTAANVEITLGILETYKDVYNYDALYDISLAGELLHDLAKPWVFQWKEDLSCFPEYTVAGTGAHHVFSVAESIYRELPADEIVAQACAHDHPGSPDDEKQVVGWIKAAAILAGKDPIALGLLSKDGNHLPTPHKHAGYIVHLGDHDWVLSVPVAKQSVEMLKTVAKQTYKMSDSDLNGAKFNALRNYIAANYSFMHFHSQLSMASDPVAEASKIATNIVEK